MDIQMKRGLLEVCVLAAIKNEDSYGYKIIRDIKPYVEISESTLYPILRRLETAELLTVRSVEYSGRLRKYYQDVYKRQISTVALLVIVRVSSKLNAYSLYAEFVSIMIVTCALSICLLYTSKGLPC